MNQVFFTSAPESYDLPFTETVKVVGCIRNDGDPVRMVRCNTKNKTKLEEQRKRYHKGIYFFVNRQDLEEIWGKWLNVDYKQIDG